MIAIPNMDKPKNCTECPFKRDGECLARTEEDNADSYHQLYQRCPLIEIDNEAIDIAQDIIDGCKELKERINIDLVRCGECSWYEKPSCRWHNIDNKPTDFCSYGERRADE